MAYATQQDLVDAYGESELIANSDRVGAGVVDTGVVTAMLDKASNTINAYIGTRYALPLLSVPDELKGICCDLARYSLFSTEVPELVVANRDSAIAFLKDISAGRAILDVPAPAGAPASSNKAMVQPGPTTLSRKQLGSL